MITKEQAINEDNFHYGKCAEPIGPRGGVSTRIFIRRRTGKTKVWKTRPDDFVVPVKFGLYQYECITQNNQANYHTESDCPIRGCYG